MALTKITPQMFDTSATAHDLNVDNGTFVVDGSASRVGIGTTTPSTLLDVTGALTATTIAGTLTTAAQANITSLGTLTALTSSGDITISTGSGTGGRYLILDNTDTGGRDYRLISTNNAHGSLGGGDFAILDNDVSGNDAAKTRLLIDSSGNIGIGTTTPSTLLDVNGNVTVSSTGATELTLSGNFPRLYFVDTSGSDLDAYIVNNANGLFFGKTNSPTSSNDIMMLDLTNQRVGIGIATPTTKFHIFDGGTDTGLRIQSAASADNTSSITFDSRLADNTNKQATITAYRGNLNFSGDSGYGKVGIGTTPVSNLHVKDGSGEAKLIIQAGSNSNSAILQFGDSVDVSRGGIEYTSTDDMVLSTNNFAEAMRIRYTGNVGVNYTAPKEKLHVVGAAVFDGNHATATNAFRADEGVLIHGAGNIGYITAVSHGNNAVDLQLRALNGGSANSNQLVLDSEGGVAIGTSATPNGSLSVAGVLSLEPGGPVAISAANSRPNIARSADGELRIAAGKDTNGYITFHTTTSGSTNVTEKLRINGSGHLIPAVNNTYSLGSSSARFYQLWAGTNVVSPAFIATGNSTSGGFYLVDTAGSGRPVVTSDSNNWTNIRPTGSGANVSINNFANSANLFTITDAGNVGLNENTPTSYYSKTFQINGSGNTSAIKMTNTSTGNANGRGHDIASDAADLRIVNREVGNIQLYTSGSVGSPQLGLQVDANGLVKMPKQTHVQGRGNTGWTAFNNGTWNLQPMASNAVMSSNRGNHYSTSNKRFTAPVDGVYLIKASWYIYHPATSTRGSQYIHPGIWVNGASTWNSGYQPYIIFWT